MDFSGSVEDVYDYIIEFVRAAVYGLDAKMDRVRVAVVTYDDAAKVQFYLNTYSVWILYILFIAYLLCGDLISSIRFTVIIAY